MSDLTEESISRRIREILSANFDVDPGQIGPDATFRGTFGMDSLDIVDFVFFLQREFGLQGELDDYRELHTVEKLCAFIRQRSPQSP